MPDMQPTVSASVPRQADAASPPVRAKSASRVMLYRSRVRHVYREEGSMQQPPYPRQYPTRAVPSGQIRPANTSQAPPVRR